LRILKIFGIAHIFENCLDIFPLTEHELKSWIKYLVEKFIQFLLIIPNVFFKGINLIVNLSLLSSFLILTIQQLTHKFLILNMIQNILNQAVKNCGFLRLLHFSFKILKIWQISFKLVYFILNSFLYREYIFK